MRRMFSKNQIEKMAKAVIDATLEDEVFAGDGFVYADNGDVNYIDSLWDYLVEQGVSGANVDYWGNKVLGFDETGDAIPVDPNPLPTEVVEIEFTEDDWDSDEEVYTKTLSSLSNGIYIITFDGTPAHIDAELKIKCPDLLAFIPASDIPLDAFGGIQYSENLRHCAFLASAVDGAPFVFNNGVLFFVNTDL